LRLFTATAVALALATSACEVNVNEGNNVGSEERQQQHRAEQDGQDDSNPQSLARALELARQSADEQRRAQLRQQARNEMQQLRFVVDISDRKLRVYNGEQVMRTHDVAVGSEEWPTPTGSWRFHRVDINPEWTPPTNEEWAKDETKKAPGDPENPMGQARLVYRMPNTVHGTDDTSSLGKAVSHGSIRVANEVALQLAEILLKAGGSWAGPDWFRQMVQNRSEEYQVKLDNPVPIEVQE
jgi:lipoprotein-anchoring transpeptidase ErfK/SrfK